MGFGPETPVPKTITASITATGPLSLGARRTPRARPGLGSGKPPREPHIFISPPHFYIALKSPGGAAALPSCPTPAPPTSQPVSFLSPEKPQEFWQPRGLRR